MYQGKEVLNKTLASSRNKIPIILIHETTFLHLAREKNTAAEQFCSSPPRVLRRALSTFLSLESYIGTQSLYMYMQKLQAHKILNYYTQRHK